MRREDTCRRVYYRREERGVEVGREIIGKEQKEEAIYLYTSEQNGAWLSKG